MEVKSNFCAGEAAQMGVTWLLVGLGVLVAGVAAERGLALFRTRVIRAEALGRYALSFLKDERRASSIVA